MSEDEWVQQAMTNDSVVVGLLLKLSQAPPPTKRVDVGAALRVEWSVRQRRSRQVTRKKEDATTRASPTTPLSWSGATASSVSGGVGVGAAAAAAADGFVESSLAAQPVDTARSEVAVASETPPARRSRRKKTLSELKVEENLLLKERRNLRDELQTLRFNVDKQRAWNESLKRLKLDLLSQLTTSSVMVSAESKVNFIQSQQIKVVCNPGHSTMPISAAYNESEPSPLKASTQNQIQEVDGGEYSFLLPDLNLPMDNDSSSEVLYGMS